MQPFDLYLTDLLIYYNNITLHIFPFLQLIIIERKKIMTKLEESGLYWWVCFVVSG